MEETTKRKTAIERAEKARGTGYNVKYGPVPKQIDTMKSNLIDLMWLELMPKSMDIDENGNPIQ
jgi:hypothetical protein